MKRIDSIGGKGRIPIITISIVSWSLTFIVLLLLGCKSEEIPPVTNLIVTPLSGNIKTIFDFDASQSIDPDGITQLLESRWDFEGDGVWDTGFQKGLVSAHQYKQSGEYNPTVEIRDPQGLTSTKKATIEIVLNQQFTDPRDGKVYPLVRFGKLWWFARNLDYGALIGSDVSQTNNGIVEKYRFPGDDPDSLFGGLYTWDEAMAYSLHEPNTGICPTGWRIPTESDWKNLMSFFVDPSQPRFPAYWISNCRFVPDQWVPFQNYFATGAIWKLLKETGGTGFDAILVGYRDPEGRFGSSDYYFQGETASYWTSSTDSIWAIRNRFIVSLTHEGNVFQFADNRKFAFSIRCVKNAQ
jgi:uncharacterized protein (TIGR02145 family)